MQPKMEDKKTTDGAPAFVITSTPMGETGQSPSKRSYKKYVIIAVGTIVAVAIILTAILVGLYLFSEGQRDIIKLTYTRQNGAKEEVTSDSDNNIVQYHVNDPSYELWVVDDFNRDIELLKVVTDSETTCFLTPLNRTTATDPSQFIAKDNTAPNTTYTLRYNAANSPIPDTSFLGKTAKNICKGISTYWLFPSCNKTPTKTVTRTRRCSFCLGMHVVYSDVHACLGISAGNSEEMVQAVE